MSGTLAGYFNNMQRSNVYDDKHAFSEFFWFYKYEHIY